MTSSREIPAGKVRALRTDIHSRLLDRLTSSDLEAGSRLSIDGLAREFHVSPTPVREALVSLERTGLIEYRAQRGYIVAEPLNSKQISDLIGARLIVEKAALSIAFKSDRHQFGVELGNAHEHHEHAAALVYAGDGLRFDLLSDYFHADQRFHRVFFKFAGNEFLTSMHESLGAHVHRMRQTRGRGREHLDLNETLFEHQQILRCVAENDHDGAQAALETHLLNVSQRFRGMGSDHSRPT